MPQKNFIVGEDWIYYKIYCGKLIAQELIINDLAPLLRDLKKTEIITHWFFIRYNDPDFHIRLRLHISKIKNTAVLIEKIKNAICPFVESFQIWNVQIDTYQPEFNRYGLHTIHLAEKLFYYDSIFVCNAIKKSNDETNYTFVIAKRIDFWLHTFDLNDIEKRTFCDRNLKSFKAEFDVGRTTNKKLLQEYKRLQTQFIATLMDETEDKKRSIELENETQTVRKIMLIFKEKENDISKIDFLQSLIHMLVNRAFMDHQRYHEFVLYYFLTRYYQSKPFLRKY